LNWSVNYLLDWNESLSDYHNLNLNLAHSLPDIPRFVETRSMLLNRRGRIYGNGELNTENFVVCNQQTGLIVVIGKPPIASLKEAIAERVKAGVVLAFDDNISFVAEALQDWYSEKAILHLPDGALNLPEMPVEMVRFVSADEIAVLQNAPDDLKDELLIEADFTQIAGTVVDNKPVAFCYAGAITEMLWDVSIDTLVGYRHCGYAASCVAYMIHYYNTQGKQPVWGALESNQASLNLAKKLGFKAVDSLFVFEEIVKKP
jgi:hypothetical protein